MSPAAQILLTACVLLWIRIIWPRAWSLQRAEWKARARRRAFHQSMTNRRSWNRRVS